MSHALDCHIAHSNHGPTLFPTVQTSQSYFRGSIHFRFSLWLLLVLRGKKTRSPDCARRHLDSQNTTHSNNYNTIYWLLKRTKSNRLYLYLMSCLCVAPLPLRKNCRATAWRMIVFTKVHRLGCLLRERISLATLSFYNVISKSLHTRTFCPWRKQKKNLLLSIWPLTPTRASRLFSSPFDCACALVETIFPLGVSHSLSERTC